MKAIKLFLIAALISCTSCSSLAVDYHLARVTETTRVTNQNYHIKRIKELAAPGSEYAAPDKNIVQPTTSFSQGMGGFTTSNG